MNDAPPAGRPWGFWATLGLSLAIMVATVIAGTYVVLAYLLVDHLRYPSTDLGAVATALQSNGLLLSVTMLLTTPVALLAIWGCVRLRRRITMRDYLALHPLRVRALAGWLLAGAGVLLAIDLVAVFLDASIVQEFMSRTYATAGFLPLLWLAVVVAAPLFEEAFFRGFMFAGIANSPAGNTGAVLLTALVWAVQHIQYGPGWIGVIFLLGLFLGVVRARSGSIYPTVAIHALANLVAMIETAVAVAGGGA